MKRFISFLLVVILAFSMLCVPANAIGYATKSTNSYEHDILIGAVKWGLHFFSPINLNESHIHGTVKKEAVSFLTDNSPFAHASTILKMKNGSFICAWFSGAEEGAMDTRIWYSIKKPNGSWGKPVQLQDGINYSHWNPVLYLTKEGNVRLYYKSNGSCKDWIGYYCESRDCGKTWSAPQVINFESDTGLTAGGPVKNKCLRTSRGLLLAPNSYETNEVRRAVIEYSTDDGATWHDSGEIRAYSDSGEEVMIIQPTLWESKDGSVHALLRSKDYFIYRTDSYDGGMTWCPAYRTGLLNNNSGIDLVKSDDGYLWLVCNPAFSVRSPLTLYVSKDDGNTWLSVMDIEKFLPIEFSYPSIIADGRTLYITYTNMRMGINCLTIRY